MDRSAESGVDDGANVAREPDFKFRAFHLGLQIWLQIGGIGQLDEGAAVGDHGHLLGVADFNGSDVGIFENVLLQEGHVDVLLARGGEAEHHAKEQNRF